jgi:hypothetical protein
MNVKREGDLTAIYSLDQGDIVPSEHYTPYTERKVVSLHVMIPLITTYQQDVLSFPWSALLQPDRAPSS